MQGIESAAKEDKGMPPIRMSERIYRIQKKEGQKAPLLKLSLIHI